MLSKPLYRLHLLNTLCNNVARTEKFENIYQSYAESLNSLGRHIIYRYDNNPFILDDF